MKFSKQWLENMLEKTLANTNSAAPQYATQDLSKMLTMSGLEVESLHKTADDFCGVVLAYIVDAVQHPNAEKLRICQVKISNDETVPLRQIVCGAKNARAGIYVACAVGDQAVLNQNHATKPEFKINSTKLRGEVSQGMLCSATELGIDANLYMGQDGILEFSISDINLSDINLNNIEDISQHIGRDIRAVLNLDDVIFEIKLTPNRADCLSMTGIAREVLALHFLENIESLDNLENIDKNINKNIDINFNKNINKNSGFEIELKQQNTCEHFFGRSISQINAKAATPLYIKKRLIAAGMRSIDALVDISNYVMLELGQPSHFFDADKISLNKVGLNKIGSNKQLVVEAFKAFRELKNFKNNNLNNENNEKLALINHQTIDIDDETIIIHDQERVLALAGVMGGEYSKVSPETQNIYIECASWNPLFIQGKTRFYKLSSEAAHRFERGVDPKMASIAIERLTQLVLEICGTENTQISTVDHAKSTEKINSERQVSLRLSRLQTVLGIALDQTTVENIFKALQFKFTYDGHQQIFTVDVPSHRFDLHLEVDLIEEVVRLYGFDKIPLRYPVAKMQYLPLKTQKTVHDFRHALAGLGYQEVVGFGFTSDVLDQNFAPIAAKPIQLLNPIAEQLNVMRQQLIGGLLEKLNYNQARHAQTVRLFEIGHVFLRNDAADQNAEKILEPTKIAGLANGLKQGTSWHKTQAPIDFYEIKGELEQLLNHLNPAELSYQTPQGKLLEICHPGRACAIFYQGAYIGFMGELHPKLMQKFAVQGVTYVFELDYAKIAKPYDNQQLIQKEIAKLPSVKRDLAWLVPEGLPAAELLASLPKKIDDIALNDAYIFDVFVPKNSQTDQGADVDANANTATQKFKSLAFSFQLSKENATLTEQEIEHCMQVVQKSLSHLGELRR